MLTRRTLLAGLPVLFAPTVARADRRPVKSVLVVFTGGGQSQLDLWDPKPDAPEEVRGEFRSIPTRVPGLRFTEHMPRLAAVADKLTVLRSVTHDDLDHGSACYLALTGRFHARKSSNPDPSAADMPVLGSVLTKVRPAGQLPHTAVHVNGPLIAPFTPAPGQYPGLLGRALQPFEADPFVPPPLADAPGRMRDRRKLLTALDRGPEPGRTAVTARAFDALLSPAAAKAFDLSKESERTHDRYGRDRSGQSLLLARRLVEAGVPWVVAFFNPNIRGQDTHPDDTDRYGWDTHNDIFDALKSHLLPRFDRSFAALIEEMSERGLLESTLVLCVGEFGRAPRVAIEKNFVGSSPGRKHWAACYSAVLAGAGVPAGTAIGASDRIGGYVKDRPVTPGDLAATLFDALGVDPGGHYTDPLGRPYPIADGKPIRW